MTPTVELLIQDIEDEKTDIENLSKNDFKRVFDTYNSLYKRCVNLKEEDFDNSEMYQRFIKHVKMINNSEFMHLSWLKDGIDNASIDNFSELRQTLTSFKVLLQRAY